MTPSVASDSLGSSLVVLRCNQASKSASLLGKWLIIVRCARPAAAATASIFAANPSRTKTSRLAVSIASSWAEADARLNCSSRSISGEAACARRVVILADRQLECMNNARNARVEYCRSIPPLRARRTIRSSIGTHKPANRRIINAPIHVNQSDAI